MSRLATLAALVLVTASLVPAALAGDPAPWTPLDSGPSGTSTAPDVPVGKVWGPKPPEPTGDPAALAPYGANLDVVRDRHGFAWPWSQGITGTGVNVAIVDDGVDIGHPDLVGRQATVPPGSPYVGWPLAYDPASMATYLTTNSTAGTWFANTTLTGAGPFEETHTIAMDATNDFGEAERLASDSRDDAAGAGGGDKEDFDLTDLYATRDAANWYFGFNAYLETRNVSYTLLIDADNGTSGAYVVPQGKPVDTNTSHAAAVNDVAFSPDGTKVATAGSDTVPGSYGVVRIWSTATGALLFTLLGHPSFPYSVAWSPSGNVLASADESHLLLWNANTGQLLYNIQYVPSGDQTIVENAVLDFSPNGTWVAASTYQFVHFFNVASGTKFGTLWAGSGNVNSVRFSPAGTEIAVALQNSTVTVFSVNATNIKPATPTQPATPLYALMASGGGHTQPVLDATWSSDGSRIASAGWDAMVLWNTATKTALAKRTDHGAWVARVAFSPTNARVVSVSFDPTDTLLVPFSAIVWDAATGAPLLRYDQTQDLNGVDWSSSDQIATASSDLTARLWTSGLAPIRILVAQRPDYALVARGTSVDDGQGAYNHGMEIATFYDWNPATQTWDGQSLVGLPVGGAQGGGTVGTALFTKFAVPRSALGDPPALSLLLLSTADNATKAQDTAPSDPNVGHKGLQFDATWQSVGAFAWRFAPSYTVSGVPTQSEYHFGFHPSPILQRRYGALGILVADTAVAGAYDTVVVDLNNDKRFDATDVTLTRASPAGALDNFDPAPGRGQGFQDGIPDVSAGMIYFIANGTNPLPYSGTVVARNAPADPTYVQRTPPNGDLVAFIGEFKLNPQTEERAKHGTQMASAILAQGTLPERINGTAPAARLIVIGNGQADPEEAWYFSVQGYDGVPGTGDEAQVVLTAFNAPSTREDGYDALSRSLDYVATQVGGGEALFVVSAGDYGFGYGTVASPAAAAAALAVGNAADYTDETPAYGGSQGPNPQFGDVATTSARGPVPLGVQKPELVAIGRGNLDIPLHAASDGSTAFSASPVTGTDVAAAVTAGAAALVYQAYRQDTGAFPDADTARRLLMAGADDLRQDTLTQGAGFLNATRSVRLAVGDANAGILPSRAAWHPGGFQGASHEAFTNLVFPGTSAATTIGVQNVGAATTVTVSDAVFVRTGGYTIVNETIKHVFYAPKGDIIFWVNDSGVSKLDLMSFTPVLLAPPVAGLWSTADLVKVTAFNPYGELINKTGETSYAVNYSYNLKAYDWTSGIALPFPAPAAISADVNLLAETNHLSNLLEVRVRSPAARLHGGLVIQLEVPDVTLSVTAHVWQFTVDFYQRQGWNWLTTPIPPISIGPGATQSFTATLTVPANAALGTYEGAILLADSARGVTTTIPVLANVAGNSPNVDLGGNVLTSDLYDNNRVYGGYDHELLNGHILRPYLGDWRYFYFDLPNQGMFASGAGFKMMADVTWGAVPSDLDIQVYGRGAVDAGSDQASARYGPYTLKVLGASEASDRPGLLTASMANEEVLAWELTSGLNVVALHANIVAGDRDHETFGGSAGWLRLDTDLTVVTNDFAGQGSMQFMSSFALPALRASAVGPATSIEFYHVPIAQDWQPFWLTAYPFEEQLARGSFTYIVKAEKVLIMEVVIQGEADVEDLDLGVFRNRLGAECVWDPDLPDPLSGEPGYWKDCELGDHDANGDLTGTDKEEYRERDCTPGAGGMSCGDGVNMNYDADGDADERVKWVSPLDGFYFVQVLGFTILADPGHFDIRISLTLATGKGYEIAEADANQIVLGTETGLPPFTPIIYHMAWDFPGDADDGGYGGAILLGTPGAPGVLVLPVNVILDTVAPTIDDVTLTVDLDDRVDSGTGRRVTDRTPQFVFTVSDASRGELDPLAFRMSLDGQDATGLAQINAQYAPLAGALGIWQATLVFTTPELADGVHLVELSVADIAGNTAETYLAVTVDAGAPLLVLDDIPEVTAATSVTLTGLTSPGASVTAGGAWLQADGLGRFSLPVSLVPGTNRIVVAAADWFQVDASGALVPGNAAVAQRTAIQDSLPPVFDLAPVVATGRSITREASVEITGILRDPFAASESGDPRDVLLSVAGALVAVRGDGSFTATVPLGEGQNGITVVATDRAGNTATATVTVTRDTAAPTLNLTPLPESVTAGTVTVAGTAEPGATVLVNGFPVTPAANGGFSKDLDLAPGLNQVEVRVLDAAGNENVARSSLVFALPARGGISGLALALILVVAAVAGFVGGLAYMRLRGVPVVEEAPGEPPGEGPPPAPEDALPPEAREEGLTPPPPAPVGAEDKAARLEKAYRDGKITKEVYEKNLAALKPAAPASDDRRAKLEKAFQEGKISQDVYERNLKALEISKPAAEAPAEDPRIARLERALKDGKITREVYEENLRKLKGTK
ncbi:MAG TPA: S8 family serine peptidase [Thermoplasmata archaeon]|nr:S8 family serine peptidase [Thermoplasmata archaeon]